MEEALTLYQSGDKFKAIQCLNTIQTCQGYELKSKICLETDLVHEAVWAQRKAIEVCPHQQDSNPDATTTTTIVIHRQEHYQRLATVIVDACIKLNTSLQFSEVLGLAQEGIPLTHDPKQLSILYFYQGVAQANLGKPDDAQLSYETSIVHNPFCPEAYVNLGVLIKDKGNHEEALQYYNKALNINSNFTIARHNACISEIALGEVCSLYGVTKIQEELAHYEAALAHQAEFWFAWLRMGILQQRIGNSSYATVCYSLAVKFNPLCLEGWNNLGVLCREMYPNPERALQCYLKALEVQPTFVPCISNLGVLFGATGDLDKAEMYCKKAIEIDPTYIEAYNHLGVMKREEGDIQGALEQYAKCLTLDIHTQNANHNKLLALNSLPVESQADLDYQFQCATEWGHRFTAFIKGQVTKPITLSITTTGTTTATGTTTTTTPINFDPQTVQTIAPPPPQLIRGPSKRPADAPLRIGFSSADFFTHSVSYFIECIFKYVKGFEIYAYHTGTTVDTRTSDLFSLITAWRQVKGNVTTNDFAQLIINDEIDILIDLTGHTCSNRLDVLIQKPALIQACMIGFPSGYGLPHGIIDYRITDGIADPIHTTQGYTEKLARLPGCFLCYTPSQLAPDVAPLPALIETNTQSTVTFGSFNNFCKMNPRVVELWSRILTKVPNSKLLLKARCLTSQRVLAKYKTLFESHGINTERITFMGLAPDTTSHLSLYSKVDIALDTFPYSGTTTTFEALYMGIPVITMNTGMEFSFHAQNVSSSILTNFGDDEVSQWIVNTEDEYIDIAVRLASDLPALDKIRKTLRPRMLTSDLCNGPKYAQQFEDMIHQWIQDKIDDTQISTSTS
jgi:protein O-GlcNAc transferase